MKKRLALILSFVLCTGLLTGCAGAGNGAGGKPASNTGDNPVAVSTAADVTAGPITVVSREAGSGTRGAFVELFGVEVKDSDDNKQDMTTEDADIVSQTEAMILSVSGDSSSIGYISLGSLNDSVKALRIDSAEATAENVKSGTYKIARPFMIATKVGAKDLAKDFIDFILSKEGQEVVGKSYIEVSDSAVAYAGSKPEGKIVVAGSSSVTPIMEKLKEAYCALNPAATIEIQMSDSSAGLTAAIDGNCDIAMASRELKDTEKASLTPIQIAIDGIAVVVNRANTYEELTSEQVRQIYTGKATDWDFK